MPDSQISDIDALLTAFDSASWREMHVRATGIEVFVARLGAGQNPMTRRSQTAPLDLVALKAPHSGNFSPVLRPGDHFTAGNSVAVLELIDERRDVLARQDGVVQAVIAEAGAFVQFDDILLLIAPARAAP